MIPQFPEFKKLALEDRNTVRHFTEKFLPYSDFNFTSMWSWNTQDDMELSVYKDNLVVRFPDYITGEPFYSFIGTYNAPETVAELLSLAKTMHALPFLKLLPSTSTIGVDAALYDVSHDRDNFDYVLSTEALSNYEGSVYAKKRNYSRRFMREYPQCTCTLLDLGNPVIRKKLNDTFDVWVAEKEMDLQSAAHEQIALNRCMMLPSDNFIVLGIFDGERLIAFWLTELLERQFAISHFEKAAVSTYVGVYQYMRQAGSKILCEHGVKYINLEQDLGIAGLRISKDSYNPCDYLEKFVIRPRSITQQ